MQEEDCKSNKIKERGDKNEGRENCRLKSDYIEKEEDDLKRKRKEMEEKQI
jgi:hypothetical protein